MTKAAGAGAGCRMATATEKGMVVGGLFRSSDGSISSIATAGDGDTRGHGVPALAADTFAAQQGQCFLGTIRAMGFIGGRQQVIEQRPERCFVRIHKVWDLSSWAID